jgi:chemotaxis protein MotB
VVRHLHSQGIAAPRMKAIGYADTAPLADNDSPAGRAANRRVEIILEAPTPVR